MTFEPPVTPSRRRNMQAIRAKDTLPEKRLRSALHRLGYRFRLHVRDLPGTPDIVFPAKRAAIDVRGCFWHQHDAALCSKRNKTPASRREWWAEKLASNVARDARNEGALSSRGWRVAVVWECELRDLPTVINRLVEFLGPPRT
ncbi:very short patch repair endonuclease [Phenylobacterium sp. LjRoot219]|uniref:very short patch repair endonuclease n=1 Tax=Phenylobacterium sp. LjRoot219 TaxID=3342283 RepID=UPI003F4FB659